MPNHGYCKNCWWWKIVQNHQHKIENGKLIETKARGICYCWSYNIFIPGAEILAYQDEDSYCPDYWNRKQGNKNGTLEEWLKNSKK